MYLRILSKSTETCGSRRLRRSGVYTRVRFFVLDCSLLFVRSAHPSQNRSRCNRADDPENQGAEETCPTLIVVLLGLCSCRNQAYLVCRPLIGETRRCHNFALFIRLLWDFEPSCDIPASVLVSSHGAIKPRERSSIHRVSLHTKLNEADSNV